MERGKSQDKAGTRTSFFGKFGGGGRDKKSEKHRPSATPSYRPADNNGSSGLEEAYNVLSDEDINEKFEQMLEDMNLSDELKQPLKKKTREQKIAMLSMHYKGSIQTMKGSTYNAKEFCIELNSPELRGERRLQILESLRVSLKNNPVSWVQEFGKTGLASLLKNLSQCADNKQEKKSLHECIKCLTAFMNNKYGLTQVLNNEQVLVLLARCIDSEDSATTIDTLNLLAIVSLVPPDGHSKVLEGLTACAEFRTHHRFQPIVNALANKQVRCAGLQLINAMVTTPEDLDFKMHLRNEFIRTGLRDHLEALEQDTSEEVMLQMNVFREHQDLDFDEYSHRYENFRNELDDPLECFHLVQSTVLNTDAEMFFLSILQHLLAIRDEADVRPQYYKLIEECVTQIVLHKNGIDPDFKYTSRFNIDVDPLIGTLSDYHAEERSIKASVEMEEQLEKSVTAKQEAEAKVSGLEEKVKAYEVEIDQLKTKIKDGVGAVVSSAIVKQQAGGGGGGPPPPPPPPGPGGGPPPPPPPPPPPFPGGGGPPPPPPPPFPGGGGPPPPPPPPFPGGGGPPPPPPFPGGPRTPGPPPPPGMKSPFGGSPFSSALPHGMEAKMKFNTSVPLKRANWNKINVKILEKDSFWVKVKEQELSSDDIFSGLTEQFATKVVKTADDETEDRKEKTTDDTDSSAKPAKKAKQLRVLDAKSGQNLSILLGSVKVPYKEMKRRIIEMDEDNLSEELIEQLIKYMPPQEQINKLQKEFKNEFDDLAEPEQFVVEISEIKGIVPRLTDMSFKMGFIELVSEVKPDIVAGTQALEEVKQSGRFAKILELILLFGNYMNAGTRNAQSVGYELSYITKLSNTKAADNKTTLLNFLVETVEKNYPDALKFPDDLTHLDKAARISEDALNKNLANISKSLDNLDKRLKGYKTISMSDQFKTVMSEFINTAKDQYTVLAEMHKKMDKLFKDISAFYAFDPKKYGVEELFGDLKNFKDQFVSALKENQKKRETEEKITRAKETKRLADVEKEKKRARRNQLVDMEGEGDQEGVMDNLLEALKTGSAFSVNREKRPGAQQRRTPRAAGAARIRKIRQSQVEYGLTQVLNNEQVLVLLARCIDSEDSATTIDTLNLLAIVSLVPPDGHSKVLEGLTACAEFRTHHRFQPIVNALANKQVRCAGLQLINAMVTTPEDLDFKMHLRNEFIRTGLRDHLEALEQDTSEEVMLQMNVFREHQDLDFDEYSHRYENFRNELDDPLECFHLVQSTVLNTDAEMFFLSILQHLLAIRDEADVRPQYYKLIEECVTQIVLHKNGIDPDFKYTSRFNIDVDPLIGTLSDYHAEERSIKASVEMEEQLEKSVTAKQEAEAKVSGLEEKVKAYEVEIDQLKTKIKDGVGAVVSSAIVKQQAGGGGGGPPPPPPPPGPGGGPPPPPPPPPPPFPGGGGPPPPPPPPFPGGGGPPPPPPPPFPGGGGPPPPPPFPGGPRTPGPPPPPGMKSPFGGSPFSSALPHGMEAKMKFNTSVPLKRANWNKINVKILEKDSFWVKVKEQELSSDDIFSGLTEQFATKVVKTADDETEDRKEKTTDDTDSSAKPAKKAKQLRVLDAKSGQNLSILLGSVKVPYKEMKRRIIEMDEDNLSEELIEQLIKYMPPQEQINKLQKEFKNEFDDLAEPEQFVVEISEIKGIVPRLTDMSFKMGFIELVSEVKPDIVAGTQALEEVKQSGRFAKILELILLFGNYMNAGTRNAQSVGYELSYITKLSNTKAADNKTTLLNFLVETVEKNYPDALKFPDDLTHLDKAARISEDALNKNLANISKSLDNLDKRLKGYKTISMSDQFKTVMSEFINTAKDQYTVLAEMHKKMDKLFKDISAFYAFDPKKYGVEELFGDLKNFKDQFVSALKENQKKRETEEKITRAKETKRLADVEKEKKRARRNQLVDMEGEGDQEGVMDNLLEALKTGSAFSVNREKRPGAQQRRTPRAAGAERRAQLARSRSRQDVFKGTPEIVREINFDDASESPVTRPRHQAAQPKMKSANDLADFLLESREYKK